MIWIVGITPHALGNQLAFVMEVAETLTFEEYCSDTRFRAKRPRWSAPIPLAVRRGDNCYKPLGGGRFQQLPCCHWDDVRRREHPRAKARDLSGERVLVARRFSYYGANAKSIPERLRFMVPGRGHRSKFTPDQKAAPRVEPGDGDRGVVTCRVIPWVAWAVAGGVGRAVP